MNEIKECPYRKDFRCNKSECIGKSFIKSSKDGITIVDLCIEFQDLSGWCVNADVNGSIYENFSQYEGKSEIAVNELIPISKLMRDQFL